MVDKDYRWYILFVRTNHEFKVQKHIDRIGITNYLPVRKILSQWSDRKKWIDHPMFPGYIFIRVSCREFFSALNHFSIICYVSFGNEPAVINDEIIMVIRRIESNYIECVDEIECFSCADNIKIVSGPLKGIEGIISRIDNNNFFVTEIPEINHSIKIRNEKRNDYCLLSIYIILN